jgi:hypothetical protein
VLLPLYLAVREYEPVVAKDVVKDAVPALSVAVPSVEFPFWKVTVPVAALGETLAVRVSGWLTATLLDDKEIEVVVAIALPAHTGDPVSNRPSAQTPAATQRVALEMPDFGMEDFFTIVVPRLAFGR